MNNQITKDLLTDIVKESGISDIILDYKKQMETIDPKYLECILNNFAITKIQHLVRLMRLRIVKRKKAIMIKACMDNLYIDEIIYVECEDSYAVRIRNVVNASDITLFINVSYICNVEEITEPYTRKWHNYLSIPKTKCRKIFEVIEKYEDE